MTDPGFVGASPPWWQCQCEVSVCVVAGEDARAVVLTLESVAALEGPLPEVLVLVPDHASPSAHAVLDWLMSRLWLPTLVVAGGDSIEAVRPLARAARVLTLSAGEVVRHDRLTKGSIHRSA